MNSQISPPSPLHLAWTTVATRAEAEQLAADIVEQRLAACVQIDGPIVSFYRWEGKTERAEEYRLCCKCVTATLPALEQHVLAHHPYATPEWLVVPAERVAEKYLSWAEANSTSSPL